MKRMIAAMTLAIFAAGTAVAKNDDIVRVKSFADVPTTMDRLEALVTGAGATVFARVDHGAGAAGADLVLAPAQLLIFGNPRLGTPAMQDDPLAGLYLPLRVLVYRDGAGQTWLAYEQPDEMLDDLAIPDEAAYLAKMAGALRKFTTGAAEN